MHKCIPYDIISQTPVGNGGFRRSVQRGTSINAVPYNVCANPHLVGEGFHVLPKYGRGWNPYNSCAISPRRERIYPFLFYMQIFPKNY